MRSLTTETTENRILPILSECNEMKFTNPIIRFTDDPSEVTAGSYRGDVGELVAVGAEYIQEATGAVSVSPRHATRDSEGQLPSMMEVYRKAGAILHRPPIDLTGWTPEEKHEPWSFVGAHSDV